MIATFHPALNLNRIIIQRSYAHSVEQLTSLDYFSQDQINFMNNDIVKQLKGITFEVSKRKCKNKMGQMFCIEVALVKKSLLNWFNKKYKSEFVELIPIKKFRYEKENPINWSVAKCVICKMPLKVEPTNYKTQDDEMTYGDFIICYEHKFLRNIYTNEQIQDCYQIKNLKSYYEIFQKFISIRVGLLLMLNNFNKNDLMNSELENFTDDKFADDSIIEIGNTIMQTEIKNALSSTFGMVPKFNLKFYAYIYDELIFFP